MPTLGEIKTSARQRADMENSEFISDSELTGYINAAYSEWYDLIVLRYEDYFNTELDFSIATGADTFPLPSDFYKLRGVDFNLGGDEFYNLHKFNWNRRNQFSNRIFGNVAGSGLNRVYRIIGSELQIKPKQNATGNYKLWYVPSVTLLSDDTDSFDDINGWSEYIIVDTVIRMLQKEESDVSVFRAQKQALIDRIENAAQNRDFDGIDTVTDTSLYTDSTDWGSW